MSEYKPENLARLHRAGSLALRSNAACPLPVRSRRYDDKFWQELLGDKAAGSKSEKQLKKELGF